MIPAKRFLRETADAFNDNLTLYYPKTVISLPGVNQQSQSKQSKSSVNVVTCKLRSIQ
jgi:hypothetical protein